MKGTNLGEFEELVLRSRNPSDPQLATLAATLWNYYRPKLPKTEKLIHGILNELELPGPWNAIGAAGHESESLAAVGTPAEGIWTPGAETAGQPSKLWLPGQE